MTAREIAWRMHSSLRTVTDRVFLSVRQQPVELKRISHDGDSPPEAQLDTRLITGDLTTAHSVPSSVPWYKDLVRRADDLLANRWSFFHFDRQDLGSPFIWNYEHETGRATPMTFAGSIDYRDFNVAGDAKVVWEPNRHQHLVVLARAFCVTGKLCYAEKVMDDLESWIRQCPFGQGVNWRSPLELGVRLINWVWALGLIASAEVVSSSRLREILPVAYRHLWDIQRKYSRFSSANNHLIGEAAAVFIGCTFFRSFRQSKAWKNEAARILANEIQRQTLDDGGNCERSSSYHLFVLEFFLLAEIVARRSGRTLGAAYTERLEDMFEYLAALQEGGDDLPMLGDADDGYVLDLESPATRARSVLSVGANLFGREDWGALGNGHDERVYWLLGSDVHSRSSGASNGHKEVRLRSRALATSGYYLLQAGRSSGDDRVSLTFDCGPLGYGALAAHGHADALSFSLRAFGSDVVVDPGTYDYFTYPTWRNHFRSTRAHNTVVVDGLDQSQMHGAFMWGERARAQCVRWEPSSEGGIVAGEHDGYSRLEDPVRHHRLIELAADRGEVLIWDELDAEATHDAEFCIHFAEHCVVSETARNLICVDFGRGLLDLQLDSSLSIELVRGQSSPPAGWVSRGYHRKVASTSLFARCTWAGRLALCAHMTLRRVDVDKSEYLNHKALTDEPGGRCNTARVGKG